MLMLDYSPTLAHAFVEHQVPFCVAERQIRVTGIYSPYVQTTLAHWLEHSKGNYVYMPDGRLLEWEIADARAFVKFNDPEMRRIATAPVALIDHKVRYMYEASDLPLLQVLQRLVVPKRHEEE